MYRIALLSDAPRAQELIPALSLLSHRVIELPLDSPLSTIGTEHDIVILDARQNLLKARNTAQLLKTAGITIPLMIVLTEGGMAAGFASWQGGGQPQFLEGDGDLESVGWTAAVELEGRQG